MQTNLQWQKADQQLPGYSEGQVGGAINWLRETLGGDRYVHYLECGDGLTSVFILSNCIL